MTKSDEADNFDEREKLANKQARFIDKNKHYFASSHYMICASRLYKLNWKHLITMPVSYTAAIASRRRLAASGEEERTCSRLPPPQRPIPGRVHGQTDPTARVVEKDLQSLKLDEGEPVYLLIRLPGRSIYGSCCGDLSTSFLCSVKTPRRHDKVSNQTLVYR